MFFNLAFGTKNSILDIFIGNKLFGEVREEQKKNLIFVFSILLKRIKRTLLLTEELNEKFIYFVFDKILEIKKDFLNNSQSAFIQEFLKELVEILFLEKIQLSSRVTAFIKALLGVLSPEKLVQIGSSLVFPDQRQSLFFQTLLINQLDQVSS